MVEVVGRGVVGIAVLDVGVAGVTGITETSDIGCP